MNINTRNLHLVDAINYISKIEVRETSDNDAAPNTHLKMCGFTTKPALANLAGFNNLSMDGTIKGNKY